MELEIEKIQNNKNGFTLVELVVAMGIFSVVMLAVTGLTLSLIKSHRKALAMQRTQETARYVLEAATKEIRMSIIKSNPFSGGSVLSIRTPRDGTIIDYSFNDGNKRLYRDGQPITPNDLEITGSFYLEKSNVPRRAYITIVMQALHKGIKAEEESKIYLQSGVSARSY